MAQVPTKYSKLIRKNIADAKTLWPPHCSKRTLQALRELTTGFGFSVAVGELTIINGCWYVTHTGLLRLANRRFCSGIEVEPVSQFSDPDNNRWVFKSTVYKSRRSRGFVGFGDAEPSNVSPAVRGAEMRIAETRAVNRALRKAYGIGLCSVEELGSLSFPQDHSDQPRNQVIASNGRYNSNGHSSLRDSLSLLIRKYDLDTEMIKKYAASFCGTATLRDASREAVERFIATLSDEAKTDRDRLVCKLNSFRNPLEVH